ncbi:MAG: DNA mismatch repair endonuclease MutL [Lachnospiraceae bacterium]|jgi:DNA mismatch repair protein MutL|nr:DNA mismatch repair endonuclease MutL [Lachnospiraceae bacterium]
MDRIKVLDETTINKIAAGEVIERPASVIKELVENAVDAAATRIVVEIEEGGISYIRVTDNGRGIPADEVPTAFLRHATSKIESDKDLFGIKTLGFRGEALASIAAVSHVELFTKTREESFGSSYKIAGGVEENLSESGSPDGSTFCIRQLFYNTPARRKFLKTPMTESAMIYDLLIGLALSKPHVSFSFINNREEKLHTSGNNNLKDIVYQVYGRDVANACIELINADEKSSIKGLIAKPSISRGNRAFEHFIVNGRMIKSQLLSKAVEDAYKNYSMQHRFPMVVLHISLSGEDLDVNVHPAKTEVRFKSPQAVYQAVFDIVTASLKSQVLINEADLWSNKPDKVIRNESFLREENKYTTSEPKINENNFTPNINKKENTVNNAKQDSGNTGFHDNNKRDVEYYTERMKERVRAYYSGETASETPKETNKEAPDELPFLREDARKFHRIIGQVFSTYWLIEFKDQFYIIDQHAAHERILYEQTLKALREKSHTSQQLLPPLVLQLTLREADILEQHMDSFTRLGFEMEDFGENSYAIRAVPGNLYSLNSKDLFIEIIDGLSEEACSSLNPDSIDEKLASISCKAAVKGSREMSEKEVQEMIGNLLELENPYNCPHGRPTILAMSKRELEKRFKRII